ncbi:hypothetical protein [Telmatospirillum siberiense]|uniref:Uncharacterized protein n=1 Tax=Telmatospirillum siberiense TaxID=382514 RepID=A0A2N3PLW0_9PROT|nr:hypothetical protein [Telmatospirillum siberiense]PKU21385.1 hypothetical protein CWS72_26940 [Telmatospirillum siberiense]
MTQTRLLAIPVLGVLAALAAPFAPAGAAEPTQTLANQRILPSDPPSPPDSPPPLSLLHI